MTLRLKPGPVEIPLDVQKELGRQLMGMGTVCIGSGGEIQRYPVSDLKNMLLEAEIDAAKKCWDRDPNGFVKQDAEEVGDRFTVALSRAIFLSTLEQNHVWLRRLVERLEEDGEPKKSLSKAFDAWKKVILRVPPIAVRPSRPLADVVARILDEVRAAYLARPRQPIRHLVPAELRPARIAQRAGLPPYTVSKLLSGKSVSRKNFDKFWRALAALLRSAH
jgi:hypothetical protein